VESLRAEVAELRAEVARLRTENATAVAALREDRR
jgi:ribosomal protein L29